MTLILTMTIKHPIVAKLFKLINSKHSIKKENRKVKKER